MNFAFVTKIVAEDRYLGPDLKPVPRNEAVIERRFAAEARARRRFGDEWQTFVKIEEASWEEWSAYIGRKGGRMMTPAKREALTKLNGRRPGRHMKLRREVEV